mgnify:CR=1 FL=1
MASRMLDAADHLLRHGTRSIAFRRRAVSTAYYAAFHAVDKLCADYLTRSAPRASAEYLRVYRALDHASLKNAFARSPLKDVPRLGQIGSSLVTLQTERHRADYLPPIANVFTHDRGTLLLEMAREVVKQIEAIKPRDEACRLLAISLLFKERQ